MAVEAVFGLSQWRIFRTYLAARAVAGVLLVALQFLAATDASAAQPAPLLIGGLYAASALGTAAWLLWRGGIGSTGASQRACIALTVGVDLIAFLLLSGSGSGTGLNFGALLVLPVLMAGVLMPRLQALATAAALTLALLAEAWWRSLMAPTPPSAWLGAALAGVGLLVIAWVAGELSARLQREERSALDSQARADRQAGLNRLVIQEMREGVLVLDRCRRPSTCRPRPCWGPRLRLRLRSRVLRTRCCRGLPSCALSSGPTPRGSGPRQDARWPGPTVRRE